MTDVTPLAALVNLQSLSLDANQVTDVTPLAALVNLQELYLANNQVTDVTPLAALVNLKWLYLDANQVTDVAPLAALVNLQGLYIDENQLKGFSKVLDWLKRLNLIIWNGRERVSIPTETLAQCETVHDIFDYLNQTKIQQGRELNEAKVLVVGQGSVGKTSLIKRIFKGEYNPQENKTDGIDIYRGEEFRVEVKGRSVQLNVWDFGGQEIYHATHQFFLTERSLYVLVLDSRLDRHENKVDYWLKKIEILGGDSPILIVGNKIDQHPLDINESELRQKYSSVKNIHPVSCEKKTGISHLKAILIEEIGKLGGINDVLPANWFAVKENLENTKDAYISYEKYVEICRENEVDEKQADKLIRTLHELGVVLNFKEHARLQDTNVLNPEWVTQAVYKIIDSGELSLKKGVLTRKMLNEILDTRDYPSYKQLFIVDMMRKFELCFDIIPDEKFLVPDLLAKEELNTGDWNGSLRFEYLYPIYFSSIITRFIVKMHEHISRETVWRTGVVLEYEVGGAVANEALVKADSAARKVLIFIRGHENTRREFLYRIRHTFEEIHRTFSKDFAEKDVVERVPHPRYPHVVRDYKRLLSMEINGKAFEYADELGLDLSVKEWLNGIESEQERKRQSEEKTPGSPPPARTAIIEIEKKRRELSDLEAIKGTLELQKQRLDAEAKGRATVIRGSLSFALLAVLAYSIYWSFVNREWIEQNWTKFEMVDAALPKILAMILIAFFLFGRRRVSPETTISWVESLMEKYLYRKNEFPLEEYKKTCQGIELRKKELAGLETKQPQQAG